ncbi:MAG TPA: MBL fold metallo-hydrolase [Gammaproteobacteria bacterium]|nr:MBL fold metallo-hydrolase [Gammaproteobacteria bacterium]
MNADANACLDLPDKQEDDMDIEHTHPAKLLTYVVIACSVLLDVAVGQDLNPDGIRRAEYESLRASICPAPGAATMSTAEMFDTERQRMAPVKVFDNLYMLGMKTVTAWALTTSAGIILFDAMFHYNVAETVVDSLRQLGLDPDDIEYVIISHAHNDHFGGAHYLQENFGTRIVMSVEDWEHMRSWPQVGSLAPFPRDDIAVRDGYTITLGDTTVTLVATPGHTPGTLSPIFPVRDGNDVHHVGYWGASAVSFLPPAGIVQYMASADRFARIDSRIDVPLTNHPGIDGSLLKVAALERRRPGDPHPFVEGTSAFRQWMTEIHDCAGDVLEQKLRAAR